MTHSAARITFGWLVGSMLLQLAWIQALPPFAGVDEFDHAYRASAVAHGQITSDNIPAADGRGEVITVDRTIAEAARRQCEARTYTGPDNCRPISAAGPGLVNIASAAASYNPAYYWVVGNAAEPFSGAHALYAMRLLSAFLCSLFLALAAWVICIWARTRWPLVGLMVAATPVLVYSTSIAAPNGVEMCAAISIWAALLGLTRTDFGAGIEQRLLLAAVPGALVLTTVRTTGPAFLLLIVATCVGAIGLRRTSGLIRRQLTTIVPITLTVFAATMASVWWIVTQAPNSREGAAQLSHPMLRSLQQVPLWFFQSIAAFPSRTEPAPVVVYLTYMLVFFTLMAIGWRSAARRHRWTLLSTGLVTLCLSLAVNSYFYSTDGSVWQGRYGLPYAVGLVAIAALVLDEKRWSHRRVPAMLAGGWIALVLAQVVGVTSVTLKMVNWESDIHDPVWMFHNVVIVGVLTILGWCCWALAVRRYDPPGPRPAGVRDPAEHATAPALSS